MIHNLTLSFNITLKWDTTYEIAVTAANDQGESGREKVTTFIVLPGRCTVFFPGIEFPKLKNECKIDLSRDQLSGPYFDFRYMRRLVAE